MLRLNDQQIKKALEDPDTRGLVLTFIAEYVVEPELLYGPDALDAVTLFRELETRFNTPLSEAAENRLQAMLLLRSTTGFEADPVAFTAVALALVDGQLGDLVAGGMEDISSDEALWAIFEAVCIDPHISRFEPAVTEYITELMADTTGGEDSDGDITEEIQELQRQLAAIGVPSNTIDTCLDRGMAALDALNDPQDI